MEKDIKLFNKAKELLSSISEEELSIKLDCLELEEGRKQTLIKTVTGEVDIDFYDKLNIFLYAIKNLFRDEFESLGAGKHLYSSCELYEFDPSKNGQNLIKHGISFGEVVSYSRKFGALMVPCPDKNDLERVVIFSDLANLADGHHLKLPLNPNVQSDCYIISIVHTRKMKFRFISSRVMSKTKHRKTLKNALKDIYPEDPEKKREFIDRCIAILNDNLLESHA